jgi:class 3 adenylate cyclase
MTSATGCRTCGTEPLQIARFCHGCGSPIAASDRHAEYKQVTALFAGVVHSMDIAAAVGAERLHEIMTELVNRAAAPAGDITRRPRTGLCGTSGSEHFGQRG